MNALIASREKDNLAEELASVKKSRDQLVSQESNWDELRRASEQIQSLAALIGQGETEEVKELRRIRDNYRVLEDEHAALQKRFKDQDSKVANHERIAAAARQNLSTAQERAVEWERRAKDYEQDLRATRARLEEVKLAQSQLEADHSMYQLQLDERDAHERLAKVSLLCARAIRTADIFGTIIGSRGQTARPDRSYGSTAGPRPSRRR
jgi:chromosome segregation ATPase